MADISITPANVLASAQAEIRREYKFGYAAATAGQHVYLDATNLWQKVDSDSGATGNQLSDLSGITLNGGGIGQPASVCTKDPDFTLGGTMTNGSAVWSSTTAAGVTHDVPTTGARPRFLGIAKSATKMNLNPTASGAVI